MSPELNHRDPLFLEPLPSIATNKLKDNTSLTDRQKEVLVLTVLGLTDKEIGDKLGITNDAVQNHIFSLLNKMTVLNRTELIAIALSKDLVEKELLKTKLANRITLTQTLSNIEKKVLEAAVQGYGNDEIGETLSMSKSTVENQMSKIYTKLGARNRQEAVLLYLLAEPILILQT